MRKKHRSDRVTLRKEIEAALTEIDSREFFGELSRLIRWQGDADFRQMGNIGQLLCSIFEVNSVVESEGFLHYFCYCGDRWKHVGHSLRTIGALRQVGLYDDALRLLPGAVVPLEAERLNLIEALESDPSVDQRLRVVESKWESEAEELADSVRQYVRNHIDELESFLVERRRLEVVPSERPTDEEIEELAYRTGAFSGVEHALLSIEKLPLLLRLATDHQCSARFAAVEFMYVIVGALWSEIANGQGLGERETVEGIVASSANSANPNLTKWSQDVKRFLAAPDPGVALQWMERLRLE